MPRYKASLWKVWHCEELKELQAAYVDDTNHTWEECVNLAVCMFFGQCVTIEHSVREVRCFPDQALALINPMPEPEQTKEIEHDDVMHGV